STSMGGRWPWLLGLFSVSGWILGASSPSSCPGACGNVFSEGLTPEGTQTSWDKDIPAINQGEGTVSCRGVVGYDSPCGVVGAVLRLWGLGWGISQGVPFPDEPSRKVILQAFAEFERFTCIRFVAYHGQRDFISIIPMSGCFSGVGRSGGMQLVSLAPTCLQKGPGIVLHELMHVLGFWHEHARADRDSYIRVNWNEILPGFEINFIKSRSSNMLVPYDYASVMHYGRLAFSRRGLPTITPLWAPSVHIGQRWNLSTSDITRVLRLYECSLSGPGPRGRGFQAHDKGGSPTPASRPHLQQLLEALLAESRSPDPGDSRAAKSPPALEKFGVAASARRPQTPAPAPSSRPGAGAPGLALEQSRPAQVPTVPPAPSLEAEDQPALLQAAWGDSVLGHFRGMPRGGDCGFCP
uniref:Metalloendopeptidase n=1 Tax=Rhinolophus ferrumequinum TaxID=59479 RepID=A0A671FV77_RHIFE